MPVVAIVTCILFGWVAKPKTIIDEVKKTGGGFKREKLYVVIIKYVASILLIILLLQSLIKF